MVNILMQKTLMDTYSVTINIDKIGKSGKPQKNTFESESEANIKIHAHRFLRNAVKDCLQHFVKNKEVRSVHSRQSTIVLNAVARLKDSVKGLSISDGDFWLKLKKNVIPAVEEVATPNTQSRYYQYDKDVLTFLNEALKPFVA